MTDDKNQFILNDYQEEIPSEEALQLIGIRLGKELYGVLIEKIREIARLLQITTVPGTAPHIMGLMNLHGEIICVVDVKILLKMGKSVVTENSRVVVIKTIEGPVGIFCDGVTEIYDISKKDAEVCLSGLSIEKSGYINGQVQTCNGLMGILNVEELLFTREK